MYLPEKVVYNKITAWVEVRFGAGSVLVPRYYPVIVIIIINA